MKSLGAALICMLPAVCAVSAPAALLVSQTQPAAQTPLRERLESEEKAPVETHIKVFAGEVRDPSGGKIPHAQIAVYRHDAPDHTHPVKTTTNQHGHFSTYLQEGTYTAVVEADGFETEYVNFEITPKGENKDLRVKLKLGLSR